MRISEFKAAGVESRQERQDRERRFFERDGMRSDASLKRR
jgi:hypothetical protein